MGRSIQTIQKQRDEINAQFLAVQQKITDLETNYASSTDKLAKELMYGNEPNGLAQDIADTESQIKVERIQLPAYEEALKNLDAELDAAKARHLAAARKRSDKSALAVAADLEAAMTQLVDAINAGRQTLKSAAAEAGVIENWPLLDASFMAKVVNYSAHMMPDGCYPQLPGPAKPGTLTDNMTGFFTRGDS